jgi:1-deoxy-D-xylulose-5-phosphate reductoisomerase
MPTVRRSVALLGATGSIGTQTLDVLRREPELFELVALSGGEQLGELASIVNEFHVTRVAVISDAHRDTLAQLVGANVDIVVGDEGLSALAASADIIVNAVLGFAGLPVTLSALKAGKRLALANKESLIAAAPLVARVRSTPGATMLPVDSEGGLP